MHRTTVDIAPALGGAGRRAYRNVVNQSHNGNGILAPSGGTPINMEFLFDGGWGHTQIDSVKHSMPASNFTGKYYEWDYSRIYLK